jgi:hypothetical protein
MDGLEKSKRGSKCRGIERERNFLDHSKQRDKKILSTQFYFVKDGGVTIAFQLKIV